MSDKKRRTVFELFEQIKETQKKENSNQVKETSFESSIDNFRFSSENLNNETSIESKKVKINTPPLLPSSPMTLKDIEKEQQEIADNTKEEERVKYSFLSDVRDKNMKRVGDEGYDPTSLYIPPEYFNKFTPFEKQFWEIKKEHFDTIVCFKKGKFYELFEEDAEIAGRLFDMKVTKRVTMKMAGFPENGYESWAHKFISAGYKVAKVDQKENLLAKKMREKDEIEENDSFIISNKNGKRKKSPGHKIIERELKEIVTPGTIYNHNFLSSSPLPFYLAIINKNLNCHKTGGNENEECFKDIHYTVLLYDASTNKGYVNTFCDSYDSGTLKTIFIQNDIKEIISNVSIRFSNCKNITVEKNERCPYLINLITEYKNTTNEIISDKMLGLVGNSINILYNYFIRLKREKLFSTLEIKELFFGNRKTSMVLEASTIENLDILINNFDFSENYSLFKTINYCSTPFGIRKLRKWILEPLIVLKEIKERRIRVTQISKPKELQEILLSLCDIERLLSKLTNSPKFKDIKTLISSLNKIEKLLMLVNKFEGMFYSNEYFNREVSKIIRLFNEKYEFIENGGKSPDASVIEDDRITPKRNDDPLNLACDKFKDKEIKIQNYLISLSKKTKLSLKYKSINKDIFQLELSSNNEEKVPDYFIPTTHTKTAKRYYTPQLKELVLEYSEAEERVFQAEHTLCKRIANEVLEDSLFYNQLIDYLATIDCYLSFYIFNFTNKNFTQPEFIEDGRLECTKLNHPIYADDYIPNDFYPQPSDKSSGLNNSLNLITGPNMGGKSTFLRSLCLNIILAQIGMNVCCINMKLPVFDNLFTRIGASDSLMRGESTFYIELNECSHILNNCTGKSFVVLDELGRGTSTADGEAISRAVLNYLYKKNTFVLFSTHYHTLVENYNKANKFYFKVIEENEDITFLYKIEEGVCGDSYGLHVAKMAEMPEEFISRVKEIKKKLINRKK